jgi:hypothetical protein
MRKGCPENMKPEIPGRDDPKIDILQLVYQWLRDPRNGRWVMVLDRNTHNGLTHGPTLLLYRVISLKLRNAKRVPREYERSRGDSGAG